MNEKFSEMNEKTERENERISIFIEEEKRASGKKNIPNGTAIRIWVHALAFEFQILNC